MTPTDPEALKVAFRVLEILDRFGVSYHIGGSYASAIHGIPRQTHDVDLVVDLRQDRVHDLARTLAAEFYVDERAVPRSATARATARSVGGCAGNRERSGRPPGC